MKRNIIGLVCIMGLVLSACDMSVTNERVIKLKTGFGEDSSTITFDPVGGTWAGSNAPKFITVTLGSEIPFPAQPPVMDGHAFNGWYTEKNGRGKPFDASYTITEDITVYAGWILQSEHSFTITFNPNGGTWEDGDTNPIPILVTSISGIPIPAVELIKDGYYFTGWNTKADGSGVPFGASYSGAENIMVYAQWKPIPVNPCYVTFYKNSGTDTAYNASPSVIPVEKGEPVDTLPQEPFREGYHFIGWNYAENGEGGEFTTASPVTDEDTKVYAKWEYDLNFLRYWVTFDSDGADTEATPRLVKASGNGGNTMPSTLPEKNGKIFSGWYTQKEGKGQGFNASFIVSAHMTVYASWKNKPTGEYFTVSFDENGGTTKAFPQVVYITPGAKITVSQMPQDPFWAGYHVERWNLQQDGSGENFTGSYVVEGDITVYAQWEQSEYTVQFIDRDDPSLVIPDQKVIYNTKITEPSPTPAKPHFIFAGWYRGIEASALKWNFKENIVTANMTLYARWDYEQPIKDLDMVGGYFDQQQEMKRGEHEYDPVPLKVEDDLGLMTSKDSYWQDLLRKINEKGIYIDLDLSNAKMDAMKGKFDPSYDTEEDVRQGKSYIRSLTLPTAATVIIGGDSSKPAFEHFTFMRKITGENVETIGGYTFCGKTIRVGGTDIYEYNLQLRTVNFPGVKTIGDGAFAYCRNLNNLEFKTATGIGYRAFYYCLALNKMDFEGVKTIGSEAFTSCISLTEAKFKSVTSISLKVFQKCLSLKDLSFPELETAHNAALLFEDSGITEVKEADFPKLKTIGNSTFEGCKELTTVYLPKVEGVGQSAFSGCALLATVNLAGLKDSISHYVFSDCKSLTLSGLTLSPTIKTIGGFSFKNCTGLVGEIPATLFPAVTKLSESAFNGCSGLTSVAFDNVTAIDNSVFVNCTSLTTVSFPKLNSTGGSAFANCGFVDILETFFPNLTSLGSSAFSSCKKLETAVFLEVTSINSNGFSNSQNLVLLKIPKIAIMEEKVFSGLNNAKELTIEMGSAALTVIGIRMFEGISTAKTITIKVPSGATGYGPVPTTYSGDNVTKNWGNAFRGIGWRADRVNHPDPPEKSGYDSEGYRKDEVVNQKITLKIEDQ